MSFGYDPELPAGFQEADFEQAAFEEEGRRHAALRRRGICTHGWLLGGGATVNRSREEIEEDRKRGSFPERVTDARVQCQNDIPDGLCLCLNCGLLVPDPIPER